MGSATLYDAFVFFFKTLESIYQKIDSGEELIFNTHNPIFLNSNLLRRDEIKFVERDPDDHTSTLFALSDFGTAGENGVRKNDDYLKNYLANQYGGIADVDFSPVFEKLNAAGNGV